MVQFRYLYAIASDGQAKLKHGDNGPSREQQQQVWKSVGAAAPAVGKGRDGGAGAVAGKRTMDYYRQLTRADHKYVDWLQKLGCLVARELMAAEWAAVATDPQKSFLLHDFPAGFTLWEHVKKSETIEAATPSAAGSTSAAASKAAKTKPHAGSGHDRMDAYLYGHPHGKKRYRSPAEFFPHLLWLLTDAGKDHDRCRCVCCCPDALQPAQTAAAISATGATGAVVKAEKRVKAAANVGKSPQKAVVKAGKDSGAPPQQQQQAIQSAQQTPVASVVTTTAVPQHSATAQARITADASQNLLIKAEQQQSAVSQPRAQAITAPQDQYQYPQQPQMSVQHNETVSSAQTPNTYEQYAPTQYNQYQPHAPEPMMFELPSQNHDQMDFADSTNYHQFAGMDYGGAQFDYGSLPLEQQYEQYILQQTQDTAGFDGVMDANQSFVDELSQWADLGQYGHQGHHSQQP